MAQTFASSIYSHMIRGSLWAILMRSSLRIVGLVNTMILARLLTPEDFGIVGMAAMAVTFLEIFADVGPYVLLIREPKVTMARCNTAWTVRVLQGTALALFVVLIGPYAVDYFQEPRVTGVLYWLALAAFLGGFENVGIALFRKELDFRSDFRFNLYARLITFAAVISLAFLIRSYWALVWGQVLGVVGRVALSYQMHAYRPRFCLENLREFLQFSISMVPINVSFFLWMRADSLILGRTLPAGAFGAYHMAAQLSHMFTTQLRSQINRALLPSFSKLVDDREKLAEAFVNVQASTLLLIAPIGLGMYAVAEELVLVVFGSQWLSAIPLLQWTAIYAVARQATNPLSGQILVVAGHERRSALLTWTKLALVMSAMVLAAFEAGAREVPMFAAFVTLAFSPVELFALARVLPVNVGKLLRSTGRPLLAAGLMAIVVGTLDLSPVGGAFVQLAAGVSIGGLVYAAAVFLLWKLDGSPNGPEAAALEQAITYLRRTHDS